MVSDPASNGTATPVTFRGKYREEEFQFCCRQHWIRLMPALLRMLLLTTLVFIAAFLLFQSAMMEELSSRHIIILFLLLFFLAIQFEFFEKFYNHFLYLIVVTDRRIHRIKKTLFITDEVQSVDIWVLQDIDKIQHGLIQCALGFGSLIIEAQETILRLHFIPDITHRYEQLMHLREQARRKVMAMGQPPSLEG